MSDRPVHTGGCLCGAIRYRAEGAPNWAAFCHCESCRRATGGVAVAYAGFPAENFHYARGRPALYASSDGVTRSFCAHCGTSLTYASARWPSEVHVLLGTADRPEDFTPQCHAYTKERLPWLHFADGLPAFATVASESVIE
jgi:hypothetical protein